MARAFAELDHENARAWQCYQRTVTRFAVDTRTVALHLERALARLDDDDGDDLCERLAVLYDVFHPVRKPDDGA